MQMQLLNPTHLSTPRLHLKGLLIDIRPETLDLRAHCVRRNS